MPFTKGKGNSDYVTLCYSGSRPLNITIGDFCWSQFRLRTLTSLFGSARVAAVSREPALLTIREATEELFGSYNLSLRKRVLNLIAANEIDCLRDGRNYFLPRTLINKWKGVDGE